MSDNADARPTTEALASIARCARQGDPSTAMQQLAPILQADPENAGALHLAGEVMLLWKRPVDALGFLDRAVGLCPDRHDIRRDLV